MGAQGVAPVSPGPGKATAASVLAQGFRRTPCVLAMAPRRPMFGAVAFAALALWLIHQTLTPAFAGVRPATSGRATSKVARQVVDDGSIEILVTIPNIGARTRLIVYRDTTLDSIKKEARTLLGFTQDFLEDKDWHMYYAPDESVELAGKMGDYPQYYRGWAPDGFEIHMRYQPNKK